MSRQQKHIIKRQILEIAGFSEADRPAVEKKLLQSFKQHMLPLIGRNLDAICPTDVHIRLDRLEIDIGSLGLDTSDKDLLERFQLAFQKKLEKIDLTDFTSGHPKRPAWETSLQGLSYFLKYGSLAWWADHTRDDQVEIWIQTILQQNPNSLLRQLPKWLKRPDWIRRLFEHTSDEILLNIFFKTSPTQEKEKWKLFFVELVSSRNPASFKQLRFNIWRILSKERLTGEVAESELTEAMQTMLWELGQKDKELKNSLLKNFKPADPFYHALKDLFDNKQSTQLQVLQELLSRILKYSPFETDYIPAWKQLFAYIDQGRFKDIQDKLQSDLAHLYQQGFHPLHLFAVTYLQVSKREAGYTLEHLQRIMVQLEIMGWIKAVNTYSTFKRTDKIDKLSLIDHMRHHRAGSRDELLVSLAKGDKLPQRFFDDPKVLAAQLREALNTLEGQSRPTTSQQVEQADPFNESEGVYLANAGLVLLGPFIKRLFERLDLIEVNDFVDIEKRKRAACLLASLASGKQQLPEYQLSLPKILCGIPLQTFVSYETPMLEEEEKEIQTLLEAVLAYAKDILGELSVEGFRNMFLMREGVLKSAGQHWVLSVERSTYDAILSRIPWGFQHIKYPWMEGPIFVEW